ncbi:uncharacterized protein PADG_04514 [Paracoccidioides brasiliensis Pb18]|uniref:Uncharacterized protein n=1 Tax=Paracoccidioides brasiliensis (strain Pb18) TaxID=502780 RepID=C1GBZ2_PARBD|nr:uncharacterized protein PADG_04514 [Paracoccidioides brasiliensis Pb18]EEH48435.1 hypothetical protein PADG_04514 [Paracoccidioides brasiliensis Pb18]
MNGNIAGSLLFHWKDAPVHRPGLRVLLGIAEQEEMKEWKGGSHSGSVDEDESLCS